MYGGKGGGGWGNTNIAVCTIEKATSLVNKMLAAGVSDNELKMMCIFLFRCPYSTQHVVLWGLIMA